VELVGVTIDWGDPRRGLFSISVAAELAGLHPQTLRIYEREGLVDPVRSAGGTRRYSPRDIGRLQEIAALTADGLNLAGVRRVLELQQETRRLQAEVERLQALLEGDRAGGSTSASRGRPAGQSGPGRTSPPQRGGAGGRAGPGRAGTDRPAGGRPPAVG
jgi:MerR family transcriptional regulator/heat shock protein HspR